MSATEPTARRIDPIALVAGLFFLAFATAALVGDVFDVWGIVSMVWPFVAVAVGIALVVTTMSRGSG